MTSTKGLFGQALPGTQAFLWLAGSNVGNGSWRVYGLANAAQPQFIRQAPSGTQYVHDATSLRITDQRTTQCEPGHNPCEVYVDFNESTVDLWDVTDKAQPALLSRTTYSDANYTHSGWPSADQRHIFVHDELEEIRRGLFTQIYTMNVDDLRNPFIVASYQGPDTTTDHNGYTKGNLLYVSHYRRGLVIFDASTPSQLREIGHFDTFLSPSANAAGLAPFCSARGSTPRRRRSIARTSRGTPTTAGRSSVSRARCAFRRRIPKRTRSRGVSGRSGRRPTSSSARPAIASLGSKRE